MKILLQFPEGLKKHAVMHAEKLRQHGHEVFLHAGPVFGACDLALEEAKAVGAKKIIHFGHAKFPVKGLGKLEVEYVEWDADVNPADLDGAIAELSKYKKIALVTTVQHVKSLPKISAYLKGNGVEALIGKGTLAAYPGQVLGCDGGAATIPEAEAVLFVGDGMFHALAVEETKPVYAFNPYTKQFKRINEEIEKLRKRRRGAIAVGIEAKSFGILLSTKPGQANLTAAKWARKQLGKLGRKAEILVAGELNAASISNFVSFDAYVNTACPRITDDIDLFGKPVLSVKMLNEMIGLLKHAGK